MAKTHFDIWADQFQPLANPRDENAGMGGCMLETFGAELVLVIETCKTKPLTVWTVVEGDSGKWYISQGYRLVNRVGYLLTQEAYDPSDAKQVKRFGARDTFYL